MPCHSVPTSPAMVRSTPHKSQPVTPQRLPAQRQQHRYSSSQSFYRSPISPASPYTPLSLRSFTSSGSGGSSTLTTPDHIGLSVKHLSFSSEVARNTPGVAKDQSLADIAENWRSRASENGIKVSSAQDESHYGDDEASERTLSDVANDSMFISTEEALLAPPFVTSQRRVELIGTRPRAQSHVPPPTSRTFSSPIVNGNTSSRVFPPASPLVARRLNQSQNANMTSTPPPNRALARQLKLKGSFTDPAHTRRREAFGPLRTPQNNVNKSLNIGLNQDTSLDLFDIDENDFEYDYEYNDPDDNDEDSLMELNFRPNTSINNSTTNAYGYPTFSLPLPSYPQQQFFPSQSQLPFADPFQGHSLTSITESVEHYFHSQVADNNIYMLQDEHPPLQHMSGPPGLGPNRARRGGYAGNPAWVPLPAPSPKTSQPSVDRKRPDITKLSGESTGPKKASSPTGCSVCLAPHPRTLAVLIPCGHPLCSVCLTSALNIVGEKDMECAVCRDKVADFKLILGDNANQKPDGLNDRNADDGRHNAEKRTSRRWEMNDKETRKSFMDPLFSSPGSGVSVDGGVDVLDSAFEFGLGLSGVRASTPKLREEGNDPQGKQGEGAELEGDRKLRERGRGMGKGEENVVLRIDNVPWDITPPQIKKWLQQPLERVHVLLDRKGKTMSHAYVEVRDLAVAGKILRGEAGDDNGGKIDSNEKRGGKPRERGSVLGKGRRARGVTVTRSGQEELLADLFPNWRGSFDGSRPSLAGLNNERVIGALEGGLIGESEVVGLLHLIKEPDSHFLKAPSLPFYSLISVLSKFPADVDSRVFWSSSVRDMLYDVTYASVQILLSRVDAGRKSSSVGTGDVEYTDELVSELVNTALNCHAFTSQQLNKFTELLESCSLPQVDPNANPASGSESSARSEPRTPDNRDLYGRISNISAATVEGEALRLSPNPGGDDGQALAELAREFGVEAQLVQALAQRLAGLC